VQTRRRDAEVASRNIEWRRGKLRKDNPMHKRNAVQLRLALSAATLCAVLAAASSSGAYRSGPLSIAMAGTSGPILARSISTIWKPVSEKFRASHRSFGAPFNDALVCSALNGE
jgi:hypothetical protein